MGMPKKTSPTPIASWEDCSLDDKEDEKEVEQEQVRLYKLPNVIHM